MRSINNFRKELTDTFQFGEDSLLTKELMHNRRSKADECDLMFAKIYFPEIFNEPWNELHKHIANLKSGNFTISGARKFGKSAFVTIAKVVKKLVTGGNGIVNISLRTLHTSKERTASIKRLISSNKLLMYDYNVKVDQDKKGHYIINGKHLIATSVLTGLRSIVDDKFKRFELSVNDDLYNINTVFSDSDNQKVFDFITSEVYGQMEDNGLSITLGNSINYKCPIRMLADKYPDKHFSLPATDASGNSNWPGHSAYTNLYWERKCKEIPYNVWMGEYMDKPIQQGDFFNAEWIRFIDVRLVKLKSVLSVIDPGYGTSESACKKGIATLGLTEDNRFICLDIYLGNDSYTSLFDYINALRARFTKWNILLFENDFNQWQLAKPYYEGWCASNYKSLPIMQFSAKDLSTEHFSSNKENRILNLIHPHQTGLFLYNSELENAPMFESYKSQYIGFGKKGSLVDGLDAMASALIMIQRLAETNSIKPLRKKEFNRNDNNWLNRF